MMARFIVVDGSESGHCCFVATVVDTTAPLMILGKPDQNPRTGMPRYDSVCECFDHADAERICSALNNAESFNASPRTAATEE